MHNNIREHPRFRGKYIGGSIFHSSFSRTLLQIGAQMKGGSMSRYRRSGLQDSNNFETELQKSRDSKRSWRRKFIALIIRQVRRW